VTLLGQIGGSQPLVDWDYVGDHLDEIWDLTVEHVTLTAWAVGIGFVISMTLALVAMRWRWTFPPLAGFCEMLYSIPSVGLFGILVPITGLGFVPAEIALVSYTLLVLLRHIVAGFDGVSPAVREAADGMGYERWRRVLRVDLPLAVPTIVAGLRIATVTTVGLVTVTGLINAGGYGNWIKEGLGASIQFPTKVTVGAVLSVALAVVLDLVLVGVERAVTPWRRTDRGGRRGRRAAPVTTTPVVLEGGAVGG
jgi:osmoprotectant transport system permease protein